MIRATIVVLTVLALIWQGIPSLRDQATRLVRPWADREYRPPTPARPATDERFPLHRNCNMSPAQTPDERKEALRRQLEHELEELLEEGGSR